MTSAGPRPGPRVVAIGGGHGAAVSLRAIRQYADEITAVVSVADDGGSSGRLRQDLPDLPAPGDIRRCIGALASDDSHLAHLLEHRFDGDSPLQGHAYGNLLLAALSFGLGSFADAVAEVSRMTGGVGRVLPATQDPVVLACTPADSPGSETIRGQVAVANTPGRRWLSLIPADPHVPQAAVDAVLAADQVVLGPGSLFTSVLATAIVPQVRDALVACSAQRIYVANLWPQSPEADGFDLADHVAALTDHGVPIDLVLADTSLPVSGRPTGPNGEIPVLQRDIADDRFLGHDPDRLGRALAELTATDA